MSTARNAKTGRHPEPATVVFSRRVKPGHTADYERLAQQMIKTSETFPGQLRATILHEADSLNYTILYSFTDRRTLQAWLDSPADVDGMEGLVDGDVQNGFREVRVGPGCDGAGRVAGAAPEVAGLAGVEVVDRDRVVEIRGVEGVVGDVD